MAKKEQLTGAGLEQSLNKALAEGSITAAQHKKSLSSLQSAGYGGKDDTAEQLKKQNKTLDKGLNSKTGDGLNSNVIKLFKEVKKNNELTKSQMKDIIDENSKRREFKSIGQRVKGKVENVKDFFTMRGFLDKTGIVKRGTGGWASDMLDAREDRQKYAKNRLKMDPYANLVGKDAASQKFMEQRGEQQKLTRQQADAQRKIAEYQNQGFSQKQIDQSPESKALEQIAKKLAKVDPALRPPGYNAQTGKVNEIELKRDKNESGSKLNQVDNKTTEADLELSNYQDEQLDYLKKIEANTAGKGGGKGGGKDGGGLFGKLTGGLGSAGDSLKKLGIGMIAMAGALFIASKAFKGFGELDWNSIGKGLVVLGGLVASALVLDKVKGQIVKGAAALGVLALVVWGISKAFQTFADLEWSTIGKGFAAIVGLGVVAAVAGAAAPLLFLGAAAIGAIGLSLLPFAAAMAIAGPSMDQFAVAMQKLSEIDALNLAAIGPALASVALGMTALGAGGVAAGIGNLVGKLLNFGGPSPMDQVIELGKHGQGVKAAADGIASLGPAMKGFAGIKAKDMDGLKAFPWDKATKFVAAGGSMAVDGNKVYNQSKANEDKKAENVANQTGGGGNTMVNAPTTISKQTQNTMVRTSIRDEDSSVKAYYKSRYANAY